MNLKLAKLAKSKAESIANAIEGEIIKEELPHETLFKDYKFEIELYTEINHELLDNILVQLQSEKYIHIKNRQWEKRIKDSGSSYSIVVYTRDRALSIHIYLDNESSSVINFTMSKLPSDEELFGGIW